LRRLRSGLSETYLLTIHYGLFHSHLNYGIILWGHAPGCEAILKLQKAALRVITSSTRLEHCRPIFRRLGVLTVHGQYIHTSLVYVRTLGAQQPEATYINTPPIVKIRSTSQDTGLQLLRDVSQQWLGSCTIGYLKLCKKFGPEEF
jgi:hypothetical protein